MCFTSNSQKVGLLLLRIRRAGALIGGWDLGGGEARAGEGGMDGSVRISSGIRAGGNVWGRRGFGWECCLSRGSQMDCVGELVRAVAQTRACM